MSEAGARPGAAPPGARSYGAGARILSIGLALTGVVTLGFFVLASHALGDEVAYGHISLLWAVTFMVCSVIYRPIEQLLARTVADSRARTGGQGSLRTPMLLQTGAALTFVLAALLLRDPLQNDVLGGEAELYWVLVGAVVVYSLSYFARGWLAGSGRPELYGALVFIESSARCLFPLAALAGLTDGTLAVALGIAAAPLISLAVVPLALRGGVAGAAPSEGALAPVAETEAAVAAPGAGAAALSMRAGAIFAGATVVVMLGEQILINAGVLVVGARGGADLAVLATATGAAGAVFNAFLVSRAPLQLFQAVQSTLLPHLAALRAGGDRAASAKALRQTMAVIGAFAAAVTAGLLVLGPWAMDLMFEPDWDYERTTLALVGVGMGLHLAAGTLNQSALAHGRAPVAATAWLLAAAIFLGWMLSDVAAEPVLRAASGYALASAVLLAGLLAIERRSLSVR